MKSLIISILVALTWLPVSAKADEDYVLVEIYPDATELINLGRSSYGVKFDLWTFPGNEIGFTGGPIIGPFAIGFGASAVSRDGKYLNADVFFVWKLPLTNVSGTSYNLFQRGYKVDDFILSKNWISFGDFPLGIVGHNTKTGGETWQLYWGPFYKFGDLAMLKNLKIAVGHDLKKFDRRWVALVFNL